MADRIIGLAVMESLTERFNLVSPTQDWEYINAQETNEDIEVLVEALEGAELSEDEDYATMLIVVNSIDALIEPGEPLPKVWDRTVSLLRRNVKAYEPSSISSFRWRASLRIGTIFPSICWPSSLSLTQTQNLPPSRARPQRCLSAGSFGALSGRRHKGGGAFRRQV